MNQYEQQLKYWTQQLDGSQPAELFCDKPRPADLSGEAGEEEVVIEGPLYKSLQDFCKAQQATPFIVLLSAFRATIFRLTGVEDATIGSIIANRNRNEAESHASFCMNMQCIRSIVRDESFEALVQQVKTTTAAALDHQDVPLEKVVAETRPITQNSSRNPLVQIAFNIHDQWDYNRSAVEKLKSNQLASPKKITFDLEFHLYCKESCFYGSVLFARDLFYSETIKSMISVFYEVLTQGMINPSIAVASLPLTGLVSSSYDLELFHAKRTDYPRESSVIDVFRRQVAANPQTVAVKDDSAQLTYLELDQRSDQLSWWLAKQQLKAEALVGVFAARSCQTIVTFLGILKANLAYLPLDANAPPGRIETILSSIPGQKLVFLGEKASSWRFKIENVETFKLTEVLKEQVRTENVSNQRVSRKITGPSATSLAYVMFTSGSTGHPKGVMIEHRGIVRLAKQADINSHLQVGIKIAHVANIAFDASTWEIYTALLNSGTLVCFDIMTVLDSAKLSIRFLQENIRIAKFTPALLEQLLTESRSMFGTLDVLVSAGDRLQPHIAQQALNCTKGIIFNAYGPTENTGHSTCFSIARDKAFTNTIPIGRAISNSGAIVMDSKQRIVPKGVIGELIVTGDGLARGYLKPEQNQDRFIDISIRNRSIRAYRTGDYARYRPVDDELDFLGRMDDQVKIRGYRIELGEIENALLNNSLIRNAAVIIQNKENTDPRLVGFVTLQQEQACGTPPLDQKGIDEVEEVNAWTEIRKAVVYANVDSIGLDRLGKDFIGWKSMYDGHEIEQHAMHEWLQDTMDAILNGCEPGHVLEIGTGTGMILFNFGEGLRSYVGLEPVETVANFVMKMAGSIPHLADKVKVHVGTAADIGSLRGLISPELIVVNSVAQYFPSPEYFRKVVVDLLRIETATYLFFGDIRSYALYDEFLMSMAMHHLGTQPSEDRLLRYTEQLKESEKELLIDPSYFTALKSQYPHLVEHVEILPKRMKSCNELSCYRYAAVIHRKRETKNSQQIHRVGKEEWIDFSHYDMNGSTLLKHLRQNSSSSMVAISNIPHSRTFLEKSVVETLKAIETSDQWNASFNKAISNSRSLSPDELVTIAKNAGFQVEISWARQFSQHGGLDAVFHHFPADHKGSRVLFQFPTDYEGRPSHSFTNRPLQFQINRKVEKLLNSFLQTRLPSYMVPSVIKVLDKMPLNQNRKVDRRALVNIAEVSATSQFSKDRVAPRNYIEHTLCEEFAAILEVDIGVTDSFFSLGGQSLMATRVVSRINKRLETGIAVKDIFDYPTVSGLSQKIRPLLGSTPYLPIPKLQHSSPVEQSFAQGRLWFLDQLHPGSTRYLMPYRLRLRGPLHFSALHSALCTLEYRHETLRTTFQQQDGVGLQIVHPFCSKDLKIVEVQKNDIENLSKILEEEQIRPFNLETEPGWRVAVFRLHDYDHVLSIVMHHIISDGWSVDVLRKELEIFYSAAVDGQDPLLQLPALPIQYRDFAVWQKEQEQVVHHEQQLKYWTRQLEGSQPAEFFVDKTRPAILSGEAGEEEMVIEGPLYKSLQDFCKAQQATPFVVLLSAFRAMHFRLTGAEDATIGSIIANRNREELENLIGFFVNLQCIRSTVLDESFEGLVQQMQSTATTAFENQDIPFERIVAETKGAIRNASRNPLVQVAFVIHDQWDYGRFRLKNLQVDPMTYTQCTRFDLEFHLYQKESGFCGSILFAQDLFYPETIKSMVSVFYEVLKQGINDPSIPITSLPLTGLVSPLDDLNLFCATDYPRESSVIDVFRQQVTANPRTVAVKDDSSQLTYLELDRQSEQFFRWLAKRGLEAETLVGVFAARSCQTIVAFLGILKANLAYLPLDVNAPPGRIKTLLSSVHGHKLVFLGEEAQSWKSQIKNVETLELTEVLHEQAKADDIPGQRSSLNITGPSATSLAYVMFTSGSTGVPKGVMIEHRSIVRLARQADINSHLRVGTKIAHVSNIAFDVSTWEIYTALLNSGTLVCFDVATVLDAIKLNTRFLHEDIRIATFTPALLEELTESQSMFGSLDVLVSAGDRLQPHIAQQALNCINGTLFNAYGPTENTGFSTCFSIARDKAFTNTIPIGRAISNSGAIVMDSKQRIVPKGVIGELIVTGDGLARGYLKPEQNQDRFIDISIRNRSIRAYRTGDYARYRPVDDELDFLGRMDDQVKIRGYRIELGEIENALLNNSLIRNAAVIIQNKENTDPRLVGFVTLQQAQASDLASNSQPVIEVHGIVEQLRSSLQAKLPSYMVPSTIKALDKMPLDQNKKVDRWALAKVAEVSATSQTSKDRVPPRNYIEHTLCEEFATILGVDVGIADSFFDLGGHSLMATRVVLRINMRLDCSISIFDFYQSPTPATLCELIRLRTNSDVPLPLPGYLHYHSRPGSRAVIVLIHGFWGQGNIFLPLIPLLDEHWDVILVHDPFFGKCNGPTTITEWSKFYLNDLSKCIPPHLPVILGGYSFGGLIAFEMASMWRDLFRNDPVSVILLDAASYPSLANFLSSEHMPEHAINHALAIFGSQQMSSVHQHFEKLRSLSFQMVEQHINEGDCLYLATPRAYRSSSAEWWKFHCPKINTCLLDCGHYDVLGRSMVEMVAQLINEHYRLLLK